MPRKEGTVSESLTVSSCPPVCVLDDYLQEKLGLLGAALVLTVFSSQSHKWWRSWLSWEVQGKTGHLLLTPAPATAWLLWSYLLSLALTTGRQGVLLCVVTTPQCSMPLEAVLPNRCKPCILPTVCSYTPHSSFPVCSHRARPWFALCPLLCCYWGINFYVTILPFWSWSLDWWQVW